MTVSKLFALAFLSLTFASGAFAATSVTAEVGARLTQCLQGQLQAAKRPSATDLKVGEEWVCTKTLFIKTNDPQSSAMQTLVIPSDQNPVGYNFAKALYNVQNTDGSAKGSREGKVDYLGFNAGGISGLLGLPYGIQNGFFWDFVRVNAQGELISEESIVNADVANWIVAAGAPSALAIGEHKVFAYSVCKTRAMRSANDQFSCFEGTQY